MQDPAAEACAETLRRLAQERLRLTRQLRNSRKKAKTLRRPGTEDVIGGFVKQIAVRIYIYSDYDEALAAQYLSTRREWNPTHSVENLSLIHI